MDINHYFSADVIPSGTGDLSAVDGATMSQQRVIRRLLTNPGDYSFHPDYGIGAGRYVGTDTGKLGELKALIASQIFQEDSVARTPLPVIEVYMEKSLLWINIQYMEITTGTMQVINMPIGA
jgi:hypothetical protein